jgi:A/G-specific adenine glycosylase
LAGVEIEVGGSLGTIKHGVTKYRITLTCLAADYVGGRLLRDAQLEWVSLKELDAYPLSVTGRRIAKLLC